MTTTPMPIAGHGQSSGGTTPMPMPTTPAGHSQIPMTTTSASGHSQTPMGTPMPMPASAGGHAQTTPTSIAGPMPGTPGGPGASIPGGLPGGGNAQQFPEGSAEDSLSRFCLAMADSNTAEAAQYISPRAKGILAQIREGTLAEEKIESLKASFQSLTPKPSRSNSAVGRSMSLTNGKEALNFTLMKEDETYMIRDMKISKLGR